nr:hypothetical protein [uncultured Mediterranean phage uvMED]
MATESDFVTFEKLKELSGCGNSGTVRAFLEKNNIPYFTTSKKGLFTTMDLINEAGRHQIGYHHENDEEIQIA